MQRYAVDFDELADRRIAPFRFAFALAHDKSSRRKPRADSGKRKAAASATRFPAERSRGKTSGIFPRKMFHVLFSRIVVKVLEG
ncbi:hypothetical protein D9M68_1005250 [compost metagenome]